jgi:hypothetical protein
MHSDANTIKLDNVEDAFSKLPLTFVPGLKAKLSVCLVFVSQLFESRKASAICT